MPRTCANFHFAVSYIFFKNPPTAFKITILRFGEKESASWKDKMTERWKTKSPPILRKDLTLEILVIPRLITVIKKEDTYYLINTEI